MKNLDLFPKLNCTHQCVAFLAKLKKPLLFILFVIAALPMLRGATYNVSTTQQLIDALNAAVAGDEIIVAAGTYQNDNVMVSGSSAYFYASADGTSATPITIRSADPNNRAILKGDDRNSLTVFRVVGDYWIVKDLRITYGQKGLVFDNSNYSQAINCEVWDTGNEAVHVRDGSDYVTLDGLHVHNTGNDNPGFGEGIYIGTDKGSWGSYDPYVDYTTVKNCVIGPNVRAEAFDIKEGSRETVVEYCTIDATGISGSNYADSFIDLKGTRTYVRYNTFNENGASNLTKGIAAIDRGVELSSYEHAIHDNTFNMDASTDNIVEAYSGTSDVYAWNNTRNPSGDMYNSGISDGCCPSWYDGSAPVQYTLSTTASNGTINPSGGDYNANSSVTLTAEGNTGYRFTNWSGDASGSNNPLTITMDSDKNITASFEVVPTYQVNITSNNGTVTPSSGTYTEGQVIELNAEPSLGYEFSGWSGDISGNDNPTSVTVNSNLNITANYSVVPTYTLTTTASNGSVAPSSGAYNQGDLVNLTAEPDPGYKFAGWSGDASGLDNPYALTMDANKSITATFAVQTCDDYSVPNPTNWIAENAWSADDDAVFSNEENALKVFYPQYSKVDVYLIQQSINTTITADELYTVKFDFKRGGNNISDIQVGFANDYEWDGPTSYIVPLKSAGAGFSNTAYVSKEVSFTPNASGTGNLVLYITFSEQPDVDNEIYLKNISVCSGSAGVPQQYTLSVSALNGFVSVDPLQDIYSKGTEVTLTAEPDNGYVFSGWSGDLEGADNPLIAMISKPLNVTANFIAPQPHTLQVENGTPNGVFLHKEAVTIVADPAPAGKRFFQWTGDISNITNVYDSITMLTMPAQDVTITALYANLYETVEKKHWHNYLLTDIPATELVNQHGAGLDGRPKPFPNPVTGKTIIVDNSAEDDARAIQNAIDNATYGDEILLKNGKITPSDKTEITGAEKNKLFPTNTAMIVNDFLVGTMI